MNVLNKNKPAIQCDLFCVVIDNFGDAGICWRLAKQLVDEFKWSVRLIIDQIDPLRAVAGVEEINQRLIDDSLKNVITETITPLHIAVWNDDIAYTHANVVIEAFACNIPHSYTQAMAQHTVPPLWLNLEYLSAENWIYACHLKPSPHPQFNLKKYFFFPGFTAQTGGLLRENYVNEWLPTTRQQRLSWAKKMGIDCDDQTTLISIFAYPNPAILALVNIFSQNLLSRTVIFLPDSPATRMLAPQFEQKHLVVGQSYQRGQCCVKIIPFSNQTEYDELLRHMDFNFVRGEDSFVRAQWARRPMCWHIHPQKDQTHLQKLNAFLALYTSDLASPMQKIILAFFHLWNNYHPEDFDRLKITWDKILENWQTIEEHTINWFEHCKKKDHLAANLVAFFDQLQSDKK